MNSPPKPIEVSTYAGHAERSGAMQAQLRDILARVDSSDIVANAIASLEQARTLAQHLKQAQVRLMRRMQDLSRTLGDTQRASEDLIIAGEEPDLAALGQCEAQHRLITRAHQRIVERLLPEAEIGETSATASHLAAQAKSLRAEAETRIAKTAQLMAEAAEF